METKVKYIPLEEITSKIGSGATPRGGDESYKESGISLIRSLNVYNFAFSYKNLAFIDDNQAAKLKNVTVLTNDILLNITGASVGRCCIVPDDILPARVNQHVAIIRINQSIAVPRYIYYVINSSTYKNALLSLSETGTTREALTKDDISRFKIPFPSLIVQQQIAAILTAYDDLIETNNQRIATLEAIAQQIYKEWFVRLRFPNWEHTPFHHGIPDGWEVCRLESLCRNLTDGTHDTPKPTSYGHFLITGKHINEENFIDFLGAYFISEDDHIKISNRSGLDEGDIIFSNIGTIGSCAVIKGEKDFSVKNVLIFKPKENYLTTFLFYLLTNKSTLEQLLLSSSGASQQFIGLTFARDFKVLVPNDNLLKDFNKLVEPLMEKKYALNESNQVLTKTRNLLLPRLISGKLTLKQATQQITSL